MKKTTFYRITLSGFSCFSLGSFQMLWKRNTHRLCSNLAFASKQARISVKILETIGGTTGWNLLCFMIVFSWSNVKCTCWQRKYHKTTLVCFTRSRLSKNIYKHIWTCKVIPIKIKQKSPKKLSPHNVLSRFWKQAPGYSSKRSSSFNIQTADFAPLNVPVKAVREQQQQQQP